MKSSLICKSITLLLALLFFLTTNSHATRSIVVDFKDKSGKTVSSSKLYNGSYALLIGVSDYTNGWPDLESIPGELEKVEALLKAKGFIVEKTMNPTHRELQNSFENFIDKYGYEKDNRLLFFFSGHGFTRKEGKRGYLVPADSPNPNEDEVGFLRKSLNMSKILSWARSMEAKHALFLFDSCFSGTIFKHKNLENAPKYISTLASKPVRQFITAGGAGETVPANSTFTPAFILGLEHNLADMNDDGYVSGTELGLYLQQKVPQHTDQNPQFGKIRDIDLSLGDFIFLAGGNLQVESEIENVNRNQSNTASIKITSSPDNALVKIDGKSAGKTPLELENLPAGNIRVRISKNGFMESSKNVALKPGRRTVVTFSLEKREKQGWLTVQAQPTNAQVRIVGSSVPYSPGMPMKTGIYTISVSANNYLTKQQRVTIEDGDDVVIDVVLKREQAQQQPIYSGTSFSQKPAKILKNGVLRVGMEVGYMPFEMLDKKGNIIGFDIDLANLMAKELGVKLELVNTAWDGIIPSLITRKFDILLSAMMITETRAKSVDFVHYIDSGQTILLNKRLQDLVNSYRDLDSSQFTIGSKLGTAGEQAAIRMIPQANYLSYETEQEGIKALANGQIDAFIYDMALNSVAIFTEGKGRIIHLHEPFIKEEIGIAVRQEDDELERWLTTFMENVRANGSYDRLFEKWFLDGSWQKNVL